MILSIQQGFRSYLVPFDVSQDKIKQKLVEVVHKAIKEIH